MHITITVFLAFSKHFTCHEGGLSFSVNYAVFFNHAKNCFQFLCSLLGVSNSQSFYAFKLNYILILYNIHQFIPEDKISLKLSKFLCFQIELYFDTI